MRMRTWSILAVLAIVAVSATAVVAHESRGQERRDRVHAWAEECQKEHTAEECRAMYRERTGHHDARMERCMENHTERECRHHFEQERRCHADPDACRRAG